MSLRTLIRNFVERHRGAGDPDEELLPAPVVAWLSLPLSFDDVEALHRLDEALGDDAALTRCERFDVLRNDGQWAVEWRAGVMMPDRETYTATSDVSAAHAVTQVIEMAITARPPARAGGGK